ncbi:MAG: glycosyltransferase [Methylobacter sp.]
MNIKKQPKIAVLLAAYNGQEYIEEQLDSILNQKDIDVSIFISIDLSTDNTYEWCLEFSHLHANVMILHYGAQFGGAAKNFFRLIRDVDFSTFDYISFSDQDDIWLLDKLIRAVNKIKETNSNGYSSNVMAFWLTGKRKLVEKSQPQRAWDYLFEAAGPGCTYVLSVDLASEIKKAVVKNWPEINKIGLHDWFIYAYARANGFNWFIDAWPSLLYRQHLDNQVGANKGWKAFSYRLKKVVGGWGIEQSALIAKLVGKGNSSFVRDWCDFERFGFLKLAFSANKCRRKPVERILFFFACFLMAIVGKR